MARAHKLISKINKSTKATEKLIKKSVKKFINSCPTRWSSTFLMISRLLEVKSFLVSVCEELGWNTQILSNFQWRPLEMTESLLKPFTQFTTLTSAKESRTISLVVPILLQLEMHLQDEVSKYNFVIHFSVASASYIFISWLLTLIFLHYVARLQKNQVFLSSIAKKMLQELK